MHQACIISEGALDDPAVPAEPGAGLHAAAGDPRSDPSGAQLGRVLWIFAEPENDGGDDQDGPVVGGSFGVAGGQGAELLESGEAAFDDVAPGVDVAIAGRWAAAGRAFGL